MRAQVEHRPSPATDHVEEPRVAGLGLAAPTQTWDQDAALAYLAERSETYRSPIARRIFRSSGVKTRHIAMTPDNLDPGPDPDVAHAGFAVHALQLAEDAAARAIADAGLTPDDIDSLIVATSTGYLCPGVAARIAPRLGLRRQAMRTEVVGAGCAAALPTLQRAYDHVRAHPERVAVAVCVEVCSACFYVDDDVETIVGNAICADGAAAVVLAGATSGLETLSAGSSQTGPAPRLHGFATASDPDALDLVGFAHPGGRLRIVLSKHVPTLAPPLVRAAAETSLASINLGLSSVDHWIVHSGGRRVLDKLSSDFGFDDEVLAPSRAVLSAYGNMSSPTVLFVLARHLAERAPKPGALGVLAALGPGLVAETALLSW